MENNQKAAEIILGLKRAIKYNEKKLLQEGVVLPVITSVRKRTKRLYRFVLTITTFLILISLVRLFFGDTSFFAVLFPFGFGVYLTYFIYRRNKHIESVLKESETML